MRLRWSPDAAADFERIVKHIRKGDPEAARRVSQTIYDGVGRLSQFPHSGRPGRVRDTRELVFPGLPFLAVYRVAVGAVDTARILPGRQRWP